jgi:hypothetical protein
LSIKPDGLRKVVFSLFLLCAYLPWGNPVFASGSNTLPVPAAGKTPKTVNSAAAVRSLERATSLLASADWEQASFEAKLGESYDPAMADFPYIEALSLAARNAPRADIIARVEYSLSDGLFWRTYTKNDAKVLCARLYAETCQYGDALSRLEGTSITATADADYVRVLALYGLGRVRSARSAVSAALDRWPFDSRFPRVFLEREAKNLPDEAALKIAAVIISRLYLWENDDRFLLILAVPFESDPAVRVRNIRTYRGMGNRDSSTGQVIPLEPLSALYALEYGLLDEAAAVDEIFSAEKTGIRLSDLARLCQLTGSATVRKTIADRLSSYNGIITDDANGDGIIDTRMLYRLGRPVQAEFDRNQDGYPLYTVDCDLGAPTTITGSRGSFTVTYDTYPAVRNVVYGLRKYTLMPLSLSWAPVTWKKQSFDFPGVDFYTIQLTGVESLLTEKLLVTSSSFFTEPATDRPGGEVRVSLEAGVPVSSESRERGQIYAWTTYTRGFPSLTKEDRDGDGYFETTKTYTLTGKLSSVLVDGNGNRKIEYREDYSDDGAVRQRWDSDENGVYEVTCTTSPSGTQITDWMRPDTGDMVRITVENGIPRSVSYGAVIRPVIQDPVAPVWWINKVPVNSAVIVKKINDAFNRESSPVVTCTITVDGKQIQAVRTGGILFAELLDE